MPRVVWNTAGTRLFETGIDRGMLYVNGSGVVWNGLTALEESPDGGELNRYYLDGRAYLADIGSSNYRATLSAFYSPQEFEQCDGIAYVGNGLSATDQPRKPFGLSYRNRIGNDLKSTDYAYEIHLLYNAVVAPTQHSYETLDSDLDLEPLQWDIYAVPLEYPGLKPTPHFTIDSVRTPAAKMTQLENIIYGSSTTTARMPTAAELAAIFV